MTYIKLIDNIPVPYSLPRLRKENPDVSYPREMTDEKLAEHGLFPLVDVLPDVTETQVVTKGDISQINGVWTQTYSVRDKTPDEITAEAEAAKDGTMRRLDVGDVERVLLKISFLQENRLRVLEGKSKIIFKH